MGWVYSDLSRHWLVLLLQFLQTGAIFWWICVKVFGGSLQYKRYTIWQSNDQFSGYHFIMEPCALCNYSSESWKMCDSKDTCEWQGKKCLLLCGTRISLMSWWRNSDIVNLLVPLFSLHFLASFSPKKPAIFLKNVSLLETRLSSRTPHPSQL